MACQPQEHNFVSQTEYTTVEETDCVVLQEGEQIRRCTKCGKKPNELDDFELPTESQQEQQKTTSKNTSETVRTNQTTDDAVFIDNPPNKTMTDSSDQSSQVTTKETSTETQVQLVCPVCDYSIIYKNTSQYAGDSCPDCKSAYLEFN